ncbi:rod shape-determining protein MreD [Roseovarius sp. SCSIO 43702]|uniref:rod shape-determining protein MreD n=1 Tax=Roseovarius sp. SCSIO 43702 TaxID=2823043 RepID=UPI001C73487D|nr:rod shape-determining protein MreD [Roseovarius sp. SCSIO 43702]QYX57661.1 rod shape-determining protein MreD [Roseovarius sp. SCSIO 43702]
MVERSLLRLWFMRAVFAAFCALLVFWRLLPLDTLPDGLAGPDVMVALAFAWVLRRPEYAPPLLVAAIFLVADLLFQRPPGLWAALVVMGCEALKAREPGLRDMGFLPEWLSVATTMAAIWLLFRIVLAILFVPQAPLGLSLMQLALTVAVYPLVVFLSSALFGVRKIRPGDAESLGMRA